MSHFERGCMFCDGLGRIVTMAGSPFSADDPPQVVQDRPCRCCSGTGVIISQPRVNLVGGGMIYPVMMVSNDR